MQQHLKILGICSIVYHTLSALIVVILVPIIMAAMVLAEDAIATGIIGTVSTVVIVIVLALTLPGIIGGIGLLARKRWSRILLLIANAISILSLPFGTALGIYTFWVLTNEEAIFELEG